MKVDIEVVGFRCKRKDERRSSCGHDIINSSRPCSGGHSPGQPPGTPEELVKISSGHGVGKEKRGVSCSRSRSHSASWRQTPFYSGEKSLGRTSFSAGRDPNVSRGELGMKVRISYVDPQGRVSPSPRSAMSRMASSHRTVELKRSEGQGQPDNHHGLSGWGSSVSISSVVERLYRPKTTASTREKVFKSSLDQRSGLAVREMGLLTVSSTPTFMPTIHRQRPQLTSSRAPSSLHSEVLTPDKPDISEDGASNDIPTNNQDGNDYRTPPVPDLTRSSRQSLSIRRGAPSVNGAEPWQGRRLGSVGNYAEQFGDLPRGVMTLADRRSHNIGVSNTVKQSLRKMFIERRTQSVITGRWRWPRGHSSRARVRRKTTVHHGPVVRREENAAAPVSRMFRKFRMVGFITITLIRLKAAIVVNSLDRTERSAAEIQWRTLYGEQEAEKLAFNKAHYSRERISRKMPNWALQIFEVSPEDRTEQDCRRLHALFRGMRSFNKFTEKIQLNLCRAFSYTCVGESRIVLRRGHIGHNFYFVYSGSVFVNVQDVDSDGEPFIKTEAILARGDSFGELALLKDIRRTATVSVRETCELLVVDKDVFSQVCPSIFEKELQEKKVFISRLSLFSHKWWSQDALAALCLEAQIQEFKINKIVVENNTIESWLYICMEGKCQVIRCLSEEGGEEEVNGQRGREQSVVLAEEIIELLSSASDTSPMREEDKVAEDSKEKLLSSLGLEYAETGKPGRHESGTVCGQRDGAFLEQVEAEERRKALLASNGPMTLTSLIAQKQKEGKSGLVYLNVGTLESGDVFDMSSLIKTPVQRTHGALLLVSSGARMLRLKKSVFLRLASSQAMEHTKTLVSKHPFPTEAAIMESYKRKVIWNAYKAKVLQDALRSRNLHSAPAARNRKKKATRDSDSGSLERSQNSQRLKEAQKQKTESVSDTLFERDESDSDKETEREKRGMLKSIAEGKQLPVHAVPVVKVGSETDNDRPDSADSMEKMAALHAKTIGPLVDRYGVGPGPEAVIVRRKSATPYTCRPALSDTTFVTRRGESPEDTALNHVTPV